MNWEHVLDKVLEDWLIVLILMGAFFAGVAEIIRAVKKKSNDDND